MGKQDPLIPHQTQINLGRTAGVHSIQGQRAHMEDYFQAVINVANDDQAAFFAVFDGHGGHRASHYAQQNLHHLILKHNIQEEPTQALFNGFKELDHNWLTMATMNSWDDGSTAIAVLIVNKTIYVANVGDSRAVLSCSGRAIDMSVDHKPNREDEKERIEKLGGRIIHYGTWRVEGVLAVTRAIGDRRLKKYVSAVPEIKTRVLQPGDDYLILASDGVWDVLSSQTACDLISTAKDPKEAAQILTDTAYHSHSMDNITALVIDLRSYR